MTKEKQPENETTFNPQVISVIAETSLYSVNQLAEGHGMISQAGGLEFSYGVLNKATGVYENLCGNLPSAYNVMMGLTDALVKAQDEFADSLSDSEASEPTQLSIVPE